MATLTLFSQAATGATLTADTSGYTFGVQFTVSGSGCTLTGIWFYSAATATVLPVTVAVYAVSGTSLVTSNAATWKTGPGGSAASAGSGWVYAAVTSPPALTSGVAYKACAYFGGGSNWYSTTANYWSSGAGSAGISNGVLSAPNAAGASGGNQDSFNAGGLLTYPASAFNSSNYWVDPEVTTSAPANITAPPVTATGVAGTPTFPPPPFTAASDAIPGLARPGYATPGNPLTPSAGVTVHPGIPVAAGTVPAAWTATPDITVTIGATRSRAQVTAAPVTQADGKTAGATAGDGKTIGPAAGDGKTISPTVLDRRR